MSKLIIIEGADGTGKTTLSRELGNVLFTEIVHMGPPGEVSPLKQYLASVHDNKDNYKTIYDRLHLGERVYGPIHRGVDRLGRAGQRMLERVLLGHNAVTVLCLPPFDVAQAAWRARRDQGKEMVEGEAEYLAVFRAYETIESDLPTVRHDYTQHSVDSLLTELHRLSYPRNTGPGIGAFRPGNILLVGEQVNSNVTLFNHPFVAESGSSVWLTEQLEEWGVAERNLYWVNSLRPDASWEDAGFIEELQPKLIVAMGHNAAAWCKLNGLRAVAVHHPAYWKRFKSKKPYPLQEVLR